MAVGVNAGYDVLVELKLRDVLICSDLKELMLEFLNVETTLIQKSSPLVGLGVKVAFELVLDHIFHAC